MEESIAFEAEGTLVDLLERTERGEDVVITRLGKPVARLSPLSPRRSAEQQREAEAAGKRILECREYATLGGLSIRDLIHEGHKY